MSEAVAQGNADTTYERPTRLGTALDLLDTSDRSWTILAGGTDIFPILTTESTWSRPKPRNFLDISGISELAEIRAFDDEIGIGALVTWSELVDADLPPWFECLRQAGREVGGLQIQNRATVVGNVCNASPAADGIPPLLALGAELELTNRSGSRRVAIDDFVTGNRETTIAKDEIVSRIWIPRLSDHAQSVFLKLGIRRYLVISIAAVSIVLDPNPSGAIERARIAVGACSAAAIRLTDLESDLQGRPLDASIAEVVTPDHFVDLTPIDDVRASAAYRMRAARELTVRGLIELAGG